MRSKRFSTSTWIAFCSSAYIDRKGVELKGDGRRILVIENGRASGSVPISNVDRVVIHGKAKFDTQLLGTLAENGISMVVLNPRNPKRTARFPGHFRQIER